MIGKPVDGRVCFDREGRATGKQHANGVDGGLVFALRLPVDKRPLVQLLLHGFQHVPVVLAVVEVRGNLF